MMKVKQLQQQQQQHQQHQQANSNTLREQEEGDYKQRNFLPV